MSNEKTGAGAEVGVRKIKDGRIVQREGFMEPDFIIKIFVYITFALAFLGLWRLIEIVIISL